MVLIAVSPCWECLSEGRFVVGVESARVPAVTSGGAGVVPRVFVLAVLLLVSGLATTTPPAVAGE